MNLSFQAESSSSQQVLPAKRRRGRPRKDQGLNRVGLSHLPPGFERVKENRSPQPAKFDDKDGMVGQAVAGVIEASFDAGYLLTVRIGSSHTILRGVVFKPGHYVPVTSENDVAPNVQMIQRSEVSLPLYNRTQGSNFSRERNDHNQSSHQLACTVVSRGKNSSPTAGPLVSSLGSRGTVVPVVLQPFVPPANHSILDPSSSKAEDVVTAEPLAMILPDVSATSSKYQVVTPQQLPFQVQTRNHVSAANTRIENGSHKVDVSVIAQRKESEGVKRNCVLTPGEPTMVSQGSSQSSETHLDNGDKSSDGTSQTYSDQEVANVRSSSVPIFMSNHGTGRMTELLQALQENFDNQMPLCDPLAGSGANPQEKENPDINPKGETRDGQVQ